MVYSELTFHIREVRDSIGILPHQIKVTVDSMPRCYLKGKEMDIFVFWRKDAFAKRISSMMFTSGKLQGEKLSVVMFKSVPLTTAQSCGSEPVNLAGSGSYIETEELSLHVNLKESSEWRGSCLWLVFCQALVSEAAPTAFCYEASSLREP